MAARKKDLKIFYKEKYASYREAMDKLEAKGNIVSRLDYTNFVVEYDRAHKLAKRTDPKKNIIRQIARESIDVNIKQQNLILKYNMLEDKELQKEYKKKKTLKSIRKDYFSRTNYSRQDLWNQALTSAAYFSDGSDEDFYDTARAYYESLF